MSNADQRADDLAWIMSCINPFTGEDGWDVEIRRAYEGVSHSTPDLLTDASIAEWLTYQGLLEDVALRNRLDHGQKRPEGNES